VLHRRKPNSLARTWALVITAIILYIPANILPVMTVISLGSGAPDTIMSGVIELADSGMWPLAALVFFASITVPVLVALGERDVAADPKGEPRAYQSATSVDLYTCPRMGHMHNFAGTRELLWQRIDTWSAWVMASAPPTTPTGSTTAH